MENLIDQMTNAAIEENEEDYLFYKKSMTGVFLSCLQLSHNRAMRIREAAKEAYFKFPDIPLEDDSIIKEIDDE